MEFRKFISSKNLPLIDGAKLMIVVSKMLRATKIVQCVEPVLSKKYRVCRLDDSIHMFVNK